MESFFYTVVLAKVHFLYLMGQLMPIKQCHNCSVYNFGVL